MQSQVIAIAEKSTEMTNIIKKVILERDIYLLVLHCNQKQIILTKILKFLEP